MECAVVRSMLIPFVCTIRPDDSPHTTHHCCLRVRHTWQPHARHTWQPQRGCSSKNTPYDSLSGYLHPRRVPPVPSSCSQVIPFVRTCSPALYLIAITVLAWPNSSTNPILPRSDPLWPHPRPTAGSSQHLRTTIDCASTRLANAYVLSTARAGCLRQLRSANLSEPTTK